MKNIQKGWVIMTEMHPNTEKPLMADFSFRRTRAEAVAAFISGSSASWDYWRKEYGFKAVRATQTLSID